MIPPADLSILEKVPGIEYQDQSVTFHAADFQEAYDDVDRRLIEIDNE